MKKLKPILTASLCFVVALLAVLVISGCVVDDPVKPKYTVEFYNGEILLDTQTVKEGESAIAPQAPTPDPGFRFVGWDKAFTNVTTNLKVYARFEEGEFNITNDERKTITGKRFEVAAGMTATIISGEGVVQLFQENGKAILATQSAGTAVVELVTGLDKIVRTYTVHNAITSFSVGSNLNSYLTGTSKQDYLVKTDEGYLVGTKNPYKIDLFVRGVKYRGNNVFDYPTLTFGSYELSYQLYDRDNREITDVATYISYDENGVLFKEAAVGQTFTLEVMLVPNELQTDNLPENRKVSHKVTVNQGVNVYSDQDMKIAFADLNATVINVHRNIEATIQENQYYVDNDGIKKPYNFFSMKTEEERGLHGNVYRRYHEHNIGDLVINGNYFTIDGSKLPLLKGTDYQGDQGGYVDTQNPVGKRYVVTTQSSMFRIGVDQTGAMNQNGGVTFRNLTVLGNTQAPVENNMALSGGYIGLRSDMIHLSTDNVILNYQTTNTFITNPTGSAFLNHTIATNAWANNLLLWGCGEITVENSSFATAGGASIGIIDNSKTNEDIQLTMNKTTIQNYVSQNNPWFVAYGLNSIGTLVAGVENSISQINAAAAAAGLPIQKTLLVDKTADITNSYFNFAILIQNENPVQSGGNDEPQARVIIDGVEVYRPYNYLQSNDLIKAVASAGAAFTVYGYDIAAKMMEKFLASSEYQDQIAQGGQVAAAALMKLYAECVIESIVLSDMQQHPLVNSKYLELFPAAFKCYAICELYDAKA